MIDHDDICPICFEPECTSDHHACCGCGADPYDCGELEEDCMDCEECQYGPIENAD